MAESGRIKGRSSNGGIMKTFTLSPLSEYFDDWSLLLASQKAMDGDQEEKLLSICNANNLIENEMRLITQLIAFRRRGGPLSTKVRHDKNIKFQDEIESLYNVITKIPVHTFPEPPIKAIKITLVNDEDITIKNDTLIFNICEYGFPFFEIFCEYIRKHHKPKEERKRKGKPLGLASTNKALALQILRYLENKTTLQQKEIGSIIVELFKIAGNPLPAYRSGKIAYDTIKGKR